MSGDTSSLSAGEIAGGSERTEFCTVWSKAVHEALLCHQSWLYPTPSYIATWDQGLYEKFPISDQKGTGLVGFKALHVVSY